MSEELFKYLQIFALQKKSKEELVKLVVDLQERDKKTSESYSKLRKSIKEKEAKFEETIARYKKQMDKYLNLYVEADTDKENYKRVADLKLGKAYNINSTWIDKIVFVLKEAGRPLRSSEIIEILTKNDISFRTLANKQKGLSAHLTKALKYGRIIGEKQKGQNGYLYCLKPLKEE